MSQTQIDSSLIVTSGQTAIVPSGTLMDYAGPTAPSGWLECDGSAVSRTTYATLFAAISTTWGVGDGSTTFNLPDLRRRTCIGRGGVGTGIIGNAIGNTGGEENHVLSVAELATHNHGVTDPGHNHTQNAHTHTVTDPGHNHTQNAHGHSDSGHGHGASGSSSSSSCCAGDGTSSLKSVNNVTGSFGLSISVGTGFANISSTTATNQSNTTGITNANATATNNSNTTGITTNNNGSNTGHNTIQPSAVVMKIIKT